MADGWITIGTELATDKFKFIRENFDSNNEYYAVFYIKDVTGNGYYSDIVKMK